MALGIGKAERPVQWIERQIQGGIPNSEFWATRLGKMSPNPSTLISELGGIYRQIGMGQSLESFSGHGKSVVFTMPEVSKMNRGPVCPEAWSLLATQTCRQRMTRCQVLWWKYREGAIQRCLLTNGPILPPSCTTSSHVPTLCDADHHFSLITLLFHLGLMPWLFLTILSQGFYARRGKRLALTETRET